MKKLVLAGVAIAIVVIAGFVLFRSMWAQDSTAKPREVSKRTAQTLQTKIDNIKKVEAAANPSHKKVEIEVSEAELESYVLYELRDKIPVQLDSINVQLTPGAVGADTQLTFRSNSTGNPVVDALVGGTHNLLIRGRLAGSGGRGQFDLEEIRVDGIPVPKVLINTLLEKYVKPKYPEVDLREPFDLPWGIQSIDIQTGKAKIVY